ncbi:MAG: hypothetical protein PHC41_07920 [Lachnospiraceae bacterium]|nr:hypothetical protein [Lachnospiraceae bacterium]
MNRIGKTGALVALSAVLGATTLTGCGKLDGTEAVATVGEQSIPLGVASLYLRYQQAQMETYYGSMFGENMWSMEISEGETYADTTKNNTMETLEEYYLLKAHAGDYDVAISEDQESAIAEAAKNFIAANDAATLETMGVTEDTVKELLELYTYHSLMEPVMTADVDTEVSDEEAAQTTVTYVQLSTAGTTDEEGNTVDMTDDEKAALKDQAVQIIEKINATGDVANADMDALAKEVGESLAATTTSYGSDDETLDDALKTAVGSMADGQLNGDVVEGTDAYYVLRLDKTFDEEATATKKESIVSERKTDAYTALVDEWKEADGVKVNDKVWDKVVLNDNISFTMADVTEPAEETTEEPADATGDAATEDTADTTGDTAEESTTDTTDEADAAAEE